MKCSASTLGYLLTGLLLAGHAGAQPAPPPAAPQSGPTLEEREPPRSDDPAEAALAPVPGGLTADVVARRTEAASSTVRAKQAEVEAARAKVEATAFQFVPKLTVKATYTRLSPVAANLGGALVGALHAGPLGMGPCPGPGGATCVLDSQGTPVGAAAFELKTFEDNYNLNATLGIPLSDYLLRLSHATASSSAGKHAAELALQAERLKVKTDARVLYYGWLRARGQVAVAHKSLEQVRARLKDAQAAYTLGAISKADLLRLEALVASTEVVVKQAESYQALSVQQLALTMGDPSGHEYRVGEDLMAPVSSPVTGTLPSLVAEAHANRLELRALAETSRALRRGASATSAGALPRLDAFAGADYGNPNQRYFPPQREWNLTWQLGLAASWTVGDVFIERAQAAELEANARSVDAQRQAARDGIQQEVTAMYLDRDRAEAALEATGRAVKAAEEAYRVATDLYRVGRATTTDMIDAESELLVARLKRLDAQIDLKVASARLRHAVGRDIAR